MDAGVWHDKGSKMDTLNIAPVSDGERLITGWEFLRSDLGGIWEAVRLVKKGNPESVPPWAPVTLPHCFNATDAVDPDVSYYQGPGWYRTYLAINQPHSDGRVVLHFEGAGQKTRVFVYTTEVAQHVGGYDEFTVDITKEVNEFLMTDVCREQFHCRVPVIIRCDNSRDLETIPSDLSDFNLYGGLYRYVNLLYLPPVYIDRVTVQASAGAVGGRGACVISASIKNHAGHASAEAEIRILDMAGAVIAKKKATFPAVSGRHELCSIEVDKPNLWSPDKPYLYTCRVTVSFPSGRHEVSERFGFRSFEFVNNGPFLLNGKRLLLRGTHRHEDHAGVGAAMTEEMIIAEMTLMKEMGVNFIRLAVADSAHR